MKISRQNHTNKSGYQPTKTASTLLPNVTHTQGIEGVLISFISMIWDFIVSTFFRKKQRNLYKITNLVFLFCNFKFFIALTYKIVERHKYIFICFLSNSWSETFQSSTSAICVSFSLFLALQKLGKYLIKLPFYRQY